MVSKFFGAEGGFTGFMEKVADLFLVSCLWVVCTLPLVTCATSTAALYYAVVKSVRRNRGSATNAFLSFFRDNWKQGVVLSLLYLGLGLLVAGNQYAVLQMQQGSVLRGIYQFVSVWMIIMFLYLSLYLFPVFSRFSCGPVECIKMALYIGIRHGLSSLGMTAVAVMMALVTMRFFCLILLVPGLTMLFLSLKMEKLLKKYMKAPENEEEIPWFWEN